MINLNMNIFLLKTITFLISLALSFVSSPAEYRVCSEPFYEMKPLKNPLLISDPVYDVGDSKSYFLNGGISDASIDNYEYVDVTLDTNFNGITLTPKALDETKIPTKKSTVYYNFTMSFTCAYTNTQKQELDILIPVLDTNNHEPFFDKPIYVYNLISPYEEDFNRQQYLNPITATDYDVTNSEMFFTIEENEYFDIKYNRIVPETLNKKHSAQLVIKQRGKIISNTTHVTISVTDSGFPPKSSNATLIIRPPSPSVPVFTKAFYVGHYYKNHSFVMDESPELLEGTTFYSTVIEVVNRDDQTLSDVFYCKIEDNTINIVKDSNKTLRRFYERNYSAYELVARYIDDSTGLSSQGQTALIIEMHHNL